MHLDEEQVQRLLHAELTPSAQASVRDHLAGCADCRARLVDAEEEEMWMADRLRELDHPAPRHVRAEMVARSASHTRQGWARWAAVILLAVAVAGGAYAAIRTFVAPEETTPEIRGPTPTPVTQGVGLPPGDRLVIAFAAEQPGSVATVTLTEGTEVVVRAVDGVATFTSDPDRLSIENAGSSARFEIEIPSRARHVEIRVGGALVFAKDSSAVVTRGRREAGGRYVIPLVRPDR